MTALLRERLSLGPLRRRTRPDSAAEGWARVLDAHEHPTMRRARALVDIVTPVGFGVLVAGLASWLVGWRLGWSELMLIAAAALCLFVLSALLTIGRARLDVTASVDPQRVVVGVRAVGQVDASNGGRRPALPVAVEVPVGNLVHRLVTPFLRPGAAVQDLFSAPTDHRGVLVIGPATTVRGDPLGLFRRAVVGTQATELFVHPITVPLESLGAGFVRDLEGRTTDALSMSDLAFHALRTYEPGDDRRHIHWLSSAKLPRADEFLVRQFQDTRRSHLAVILDSRPTSYRDDDEFERAISAAASIVVRVVRDGQSASVIGGGQALTGGTPRLLLDTFARVVAGPEGLGDLAGRAMRVAPDLSTALLVTGSTTPFREIRAAVSTFPVEARRVGLVVDRERATGMSVVGSLTLLYLRDVSELAALVAGGLR